MRLSRDVGLEIAGGYGMLHAYDGDDRASLDEATGKPVPVGHHRDGAVRPGPADLRRHRPGAAQHHRRARPRPAQGARLRQGARRSRTCPRTAELAARPSALRAGLSLSQPALAASCSVTTQRRSPHGQQESRRARRTRRPAVVSVDVVVVGGGLAGLTAAATAAGAGRSVVRARRSPRRQPGRHRAGRPVPVQPWRPRPVPQGGGAPVLARLRRAGHGVAAAPARRHGPAGRRRRPRCRSDPCRGPQPARVAARAWRGSARVLAGMPRWRPDDLGRQDGGRLVRRPRPRRRRAPGDRDADPHRDLRLRLRPRVRRPGRAPGEAGRDRATSSTSTVAGRRCSTGSPPPATAPGSSGVRPRHAPSCPRAGSSGSRSRPRATAPARGAATAAGPRPRSWPGRSWWRRGTPDAMAAVLPERPAAWAALAAPDPRPPASTSGWSEPPPTRVLLGLDRPLYLICHAPAGPAGARRGVRSCTACATCVPPRRLSATELRGELEDHARLAGIEPDAAEEVRYRHRMVSTGALPTPDTGGLAGRPGVTSTGLDGVFVAGDWLGPRGPPRRRRSGHGRGGRAPRRGHGPTTCAVRRRSVRGRPVEARRMGDAAAAERPCDRRRAGAGRGAAAAARASPTASRARGSTPRTSCRRPGSGRAGLGRGGRPAVGLADDGRVAAGVRPAAGRAAATRGLRRPVAARAGRGGRASRRGSGADPAHLAELAESLTFGFLRVLESLTPGRAGGVRDGRRVRRAVRRDRRGGRAQPRRLPAGGQPGPDPGARRAPGGRAVDDAEVVADSLVRRAHVGRRRPGALAARARRRARQRRRRRGPRGSPPGRRGRNGSAA